MKLKEIKKTYNDILEVCEKYKKIKSIHSSFRDIGEMSSRAKNHLLIIEWEEKYGIKIDHNQKPYTYYHINIRDNLSFSYFNDAEKEKASGKGGKYISWSDDERQPKNEWLLVINFSTGAYIFGNDYAYQQQLFQDFFNELKSYKPDFTDINNRNLYWKIENAKSIYDNFDKILKEYRERNKSEFNDRKIKKLEEELEKLKIK